MLFTQCNRGRANWASRIKLILQQHGFGYVWELQNPGDGKAFIIEFKERLKDCDVQMWRAKMEEMSKLQVYRLFKIDFNVEPYLSLNIPHRFIVSLAKFRTSNHDLEIEHGRHLGIVRENRLCKLCGKQNKIYIEDEFHVLYQCDTYNDIRKLYIMDTMNVRNHYSFINLMKSANDVCLTNLAKFVFSMSKIRRARLKET